MSIASKTLFYCFIASVFLNQLSAQVNMTQVRNSFNEKDYHQADSLLQILCDQNAYQGGYWFWRGRTNYELKDYQEAVKAYLYSDSLGHAKKWSAVGLAYSYRALNDKAKMTRWLKKLVSLDPTWLDRLRGGSFKDLMDAADYSALFGAYNKADELSGWQGDLEFLKNTLYRTHYQIDIKTPLAAWDSAYQAISNQLPRLSKEERALALARFVALAGDGHTNLWPQFHPDFTFTMLPIMIYPFSDGHFVRAADPEYSEILGAKVLQIGSMPIDQVASKLSAYVGHDNPMHDLLVRVPVMSTVQMLVDIGAISDPNEVSIKVKTSQGEQVVTLKPIPFDFELLGRKYQAPQWQKMYSAQDVPLWPQKARDGYWYEYLANYNLLYLKIDQITNKKEQSLTALVDEVFKKIEKEKIDRLVLDIRLNDGGDSNLYRPLLLALIRSRVNKPGQFFTIIGRTTYSAAMNLTTDLEYWTNTTLVGEPTGSSPVFVGENRYFTLPYSKLRISVSDRNHQRGAGSSVDKRIWVAPHIATPLTSDDFANGIDPAIAAILAMIKRDQPR